MPRAIAEAREVARLYTEVLPRGENPNHARAKKLMYRIEEHR